METFGYSFDKPHRTPAAQGMRQAPVEISVCAAWPLARVVLR